MMMREMGGGPLADAPARVTQVDKQTIRMHEELNALADALDTLENRLVKVLRCDGDKPGKDNEVEAAERLAPLAGVMWQFNMRINGLVRRVNDLTEQLEV
mgnify:CR=1 FL=1|jgi:hypothetical protein